jgi:hypothetical protein
MAKGKWVNEERQQFVLVLNHAEASALRAVTGSVGGHPVKSRRMYITNIWDELESNDVPVGNGDWEGALRFNDVILALL